MSKILLVGNPNTGKTTLFNKLTGGNGKTGNWHGVTVSSLTGKLKGTPHTVCDVPGTYSLTPYSQEEKITVEAVNGDYDLILNVVEACNIERSLSLTYELLRTGKRVAVIINMYGELKRRGGSIDVNKLSGYIGCPCVIADKNFCAENITELLLKDYAAAEKNHTSIGLPVGIFTPPQSYADNKADRVFLNPFLAIPAFFACLCGIFYITFGSYGIGAPLGDLLERAITEFIIPKTESLLLNVNVSGFFVGLITEGILGALSAVIGFIPQLTVLYLCLILLEESGLLSRAAYVFDGIFKRFGLSGKAIFPLIMGFGCSATVVLATRSLDSKTVQRRTVTALQFISCSARMPAFSLIVSAFFPGKEFIAVTLIYVLGTALGLVCAAANARLDKVFAEPFVTELPPYRFPQFKAVAKQLNYYLKTFIIKIGTVLFAVSVLVWLLRSFSLRMEFLTSDRISESVLAKIGALFSFVFKPMGFTGWQIPVVVLCGLVAKEGVVSALALVYPGGIAGEFAEESALALLIFVAYYTPCVTAVSATANEVGGRLSAFYAVFSFLAALLMGYLTYFICCLLKSCGYLNIVLTLAAAIAVIFAVKAIYKKIKHSEGCCNAEIHCRRTGAACKAGCGRRCSVSNGKKTAAR